MLKKSEMIISSFTHLPQSFLDSNIFFAVFASFACGIWPAGNSSPCLRLAYWMTSQVSQVTCTRPVKTSDAMTGHTTKTLTASLVSWFQQRLQLCSGNCWGRVKHCTSLHNARIFVFLPTFATNLSAARALLQEPVNRSIPCSQGNTLRDIKQSSAHDMQDMQHIQSVL